MDTTRFVIDYDDARFEECNGEPRPLTEEEYRGNEYQKDSQIVSYVDYRAYYGNPDRHVYLYVRREDKCPCCGSWRKGAAVYGIDFMDDDKDATYIGTFALGQLPGYLRDVAADLGDSAARLALTLTPSMT